MVAEIYRVNDGFVSGISYSAMIIKIFVGKLLKKSTFFSSFFRLGRR
jgi:hypothetical protein